MVINRLRKKRKKELILGHNSISNERPEFTREAKRDLRETRNSKKIETLVGELEEEENGLGCR